MRRKKIIFTAALILNAAVLFLLLGGKPAQTSFLNPPSGIKGPDVVLDLPWGSGGAMVGRKDGDESNPEGPMSFTVSPAGEVYILDQVNFRVVKFHADGFPASEVALPADTFNDIEVVDGKTIAVLDRLVRLSVLLIDEESGKIVGEHPVTGKGIPQGGGITAMFADEDGVWLEYDNAYVVRVLDKFLKPCSRDIMPGRIYKSGTTGMGAALKQGGGARLWLEDAGSGNIVRGTDVVLDRDIARIIWLEADAGGNVYAFFHLLEWDENDFTKPAFEKNAGVIFDKYLGRRLSFTSPYTIRVWEQYREFKVTDGGGIYQMAFTDSGVKVMRWTWN